MKVILSRKGFDSTAGGVPSPILPDGQMISLPIPDRQSHFRYCDIRWNGGNLGSIVSDLTNGRIRHDYSAHLDPDIRRGSISRSPGWRPLFGQCGPAQGHLRNCGVGAGDVFLFFGLFRRVIVRERHFAWDTTSRPVHVIWGWFQVDRALTVNQMARVPSWAEYHPHCGLRGEKNNTLYAASRNLTLPGMSGGELPGFGVFTRFSDPLQLSDPGAARHVQWRLPSWLFPENDKPSLTFHSDMRRWSKRNDAALLHSVDRGQEFVLDEQYYPQVSGWIAHMVRSCDSNCLGIDGGPPTHVNRQSQLQIRKCC